jgi:zinc transporter 7
MLSFFLLEKFARLRSEGGHGHSHGGHGHATNDALKAEDEEQEEEEEELEEEQESDSKSSIRHRTRSQSKRRPRLLASLKPSTKKWKRKQVFAVRKQEEQESDNDASTGSLKITGILNLIADATHNFTDGMAIAASFALSKQVGISTTLAVLFHEVPHEIGDYAILVQAGFTTKQAMLAQLVTALGALLGTAVGLMTGSGIAGQASWVLPFTAGGFIYIATVSVIPTLFERSSLKQTLYEVIAMLVGVSFMVIIGWFE